MDLLEAMKNEAGILTGKLAQLKRMIAEYSGIEPKPTVKAKRRKMSAAARARIGKATKARWAAYRKAKKAA